MNFPLTRRSFLKRTAIAASAISGASLFPTPNILAENSPGKKLRCVQIGCGGRGLSAHIDWIVNQGKENLVAIVDADEKRHAETKRFLAKYEAGSSDLKTFTDYRKMFDKLHKQIDAVFIATPNHQHALPAMMAIHHGIPVYCEKPLTHDIAEARTLRKMAAKAKVATQMGNQGHCEAGYRRLCEFIWGGVIGPVTETHHWTDRANGGLGPRPPKLPVPEGMNWDSWIGPAPYRDFHSDLHPHEWHGWYDFGNGSLGNMGCHVLDGVYWALKIEHPTSMECEDIFGGSDERYPIRSRIRWDIPPRENMPAFKAYWYEGFKPAFEKSQAGKNRAAKGEARYLPPLIAELQKKYLDEELDALDSGSLYVGDKGIIYTGTYGQKMHVVPLEKMNEIKQPPISLPRPKSVMADFLDAVHAGKKMTSASFDYGARLTEFTLLGNLAQHAGAGKKIEWDGPKMKVTNIKELNQWVKRPYRKGWSV